MSSAGSADGTPVDGQLSRSWSVGPSGRAWARAVVVIVWGCMVCAFFLLTGATKYVWGVGAVCFGVGLAALGIRLCFAKLTITPDSIRIRGIRTRTISRELVTAVTDTSGTLRVLPIAGWGYIPALVLSDGGRVYLNVRQHVFRDPEHRAQPCGYVGVLSDVLSVPVA